MNQPGNLDELLFKLKNAPESGRLRETMESPVGQRVLNGVDVNGLEKSMREGDTAALQSVLTQILSTSEGRALAREIQKSMKS